MRVKEIDHLIQMLSKIPGFGRRSAQRAALHLLQHKEQVMLPLAQALQHTAALLTDCDDCGNIDSQNPCHICVDGKRQSHQLCVVEEVADLWAMERSHMYRGYYHVLGGTLSAIDGRTPEQLRIDSLLARIEKNQIKEVILATNATVDGQTTAHYLTEQLRPFGVDISRLAQGIPMGGELDYLDDGTLGAALNARVAF